MNRKKALAIGGAAVAVAVIGVAASGGHHPSTPKIPAASPSTSTPVTATHSAAPLTAGEQRFVHAVRAALAAQGDSTNFAADAPRDRTDIDSRIRFRHVLVCFHRPPQFGVSGPGAITW